MNPELAVLLHRCIDECGYSWPIACQIARRMFGRQFTLDELRTIYREMK